MKLLLVGRQVHPIYPILVRYRAIRLVTTCFEQSTLNIAQYFDSYHMHSPPGALLIA